MATLVPFILHLHLAHRAGRHYDLRLQYPYKKTLASWALTKAKIPKVLGDKVLAVQTEDHDKSWLTFRGNIPEGSYGAGTVKIEQKGEAEILGWYNKAIIFRVSGSPMNGKYSLIKFKIRNKNKNNNWLLIKSKDE